MRITALLLLAVAALTVSMTEGAKAQGLPADGAFFIVWSAPDSARNGTLAAEARDNVTAAGNATLRVGFQPPSRTSSCVGGAFLTLAVTQEPAKIAGHTRYDPQSVTIAADHAPNAAGTPATRWSGPVTFHTSWYLDEIEPGGKVAFQFRTGTPTINGGSCSPGALSNVPAGKAALTVHFPAAARPPKQASDIASDTPSMPIGAVVLLVAAVALLRTRR